MLMSITTSRVLHLTAMPPGQGVPIAPVGLEAIAASLRHARRIDDAAVLPLRREVAVGPTPAGAGFVDEAPPTSRGAQRLDDFHQRLQVPGDPAVVTDLTVAALFGERDAELLQYFAGFIDFYQAEQSS